MLKLRILLLRNLLYYSILTIALIYFFITFFFINNKTIYKNTSNLSAIITNITIKDYGIKLDLKAKEKIIAYYYLDDKEKNNFIKTYFLGDKINITFVNKIITNNTVPNTFNYKKYLENKKIYNVVEITSIKKIEKNKNIFYKIKDLLLKRTYKLKKSYPYIKSLLFAENSYLEDDIVNSYRENGISHLFAISGSHISIFITFLLYLLKKLKIKENKRFFIIILFLLVYMFLTNFSMSVLRAGIFTILIFINEVFYFNIKSVNLLLLTLAIILFINPLNLLDIGLQYSFVISFSLIIMQDYLKNKKNYLTKLLAISFISFLSSLPITIYNFYSLNFLSIFNNLLFVPYVSFIILPLVFISYLFPFLDNVLFFFLNVMNHISLFLSRINTFKLIFCKPSMSIFVVYYVLIFFCFYKLKNNQKKHLILLIILLFFHYNWVFKNYNYLTFLDVSQGDSTLLTVNDTYTLIDTGGLVMYNDSKYTYNLTNDKIIPYFKSLGIKYLDNIILTHGDYDHMGEAINLVKNFKVKKVIFNCGEFNKLEKDLIKVLDKKKIPYYSCIKELNIKDNKLYFLNNKDHGNENDNSIVIYTELDNHKLLFMGDAGVEVEEELIKKYNLENIDVLKVGHHGSKTSSSEEFINEINPKYSVISVGKNNKYGHPDKETLNNLLESKVYRTDQDGSILIKIKNDKLKIETCTP